MTTPTERAVDEITGLVQQGRRRWHEVTPELIVETLGRAGLLAAPVDGDLREALARKLCPPSHRIGSGSITWPPGGIARREISEHRPCPLHQSEADALLPRIAAHVAERERKLREEIAGELAATATEYYPEDVFGPGLSTDDTRNISEALAPIGITLDRISAAVMRHAYKNAARIARGDEQ